MLQLGHAYSDDCLVSLVSASVFVSVAVLRSGGTVLDGIGSIRVTDRITLTTDLISNRREVRLRGRPAVQAVVGFHRTAALS